jgi:hypothetical protein
MKFYAGAFGKYFFYAHKSKVTLTLCHKKFQNLPCVLLKTIE